MKDILYNLIIYLINEEIDIYITEDDSLEEIINAFMEEEGLLDVIEVNNEELEEQLPTMEQITEYEAYSSWMFNLNHIKILRNFLARFIGKKSYRKYKRYAKIKNDLNNSIDFGDFYLN